MPVNIKQELAEFDKINSLKIEVDISLYNLVHNFGSLLCI